MTISIPRKMDLTPGVYDMTAEVYHADPCPAPSLSSSVAKLLLDRTPRHAWFAHPRLNPAHEEEHNAAFDLGTAAHDLLLCGEGRFAVIDAADWRTNAAKEERDEAYERGLTPLLVDQMERVKLMVSLARLQLDQHEQARDAFSDGQPERTLVWQEGGIWCRCKLDWMPNKPGPARIFPDYKTTGDSAHPDEWGTRQLFNLNYDVQAAFYRRGIRAVFGIENAHFWFVVQETSAPYALSVVSPTPAALAMADRKVTEAIRMWGWCLQNDRWPGYPNQTAFVDPPAWQEKKWLDREDRDGTSVDLIQASIDWQAPLEASK